MARIKVIDYSESEGRLREIYDDLISSRGKLADVHTIQSLRPESVVKHMDLYMEIMFTKSDLTRAEREMIAVVVSAANQCEYCQIHHASALMHYWKSETKVSQLRKDFRLLDLSRKEMSLCLYAEKMTLLPEEANDVDVTVPLKKEGFSDSAILDATLVISYFNFVNRIVLGLGLATKEEEVGGYNY